MRTIRAIEPDPVMRALAARRARRGELAVTVEDGCAEALPVGDGCADTVVVAYVLCSVADPVAALREAARVLAPGGQLVFAEHAASDGPVAARLQRGLDPFWRRFVGGCSLVRDPLAAVVNAGFTLRRCETGVFTGALAALGRHLGGIAEIGLATSAGDTDAGMR